MTPAASTSVPVRPSWQAQGPPPRRMLARLVRPTPVVVSPGPHPRPQARMPGRLGLYTRGWYPIEALDVAIACCLKVRAEEARVVRMLDTKHLEWFFASAPLLDDLLATGTCEVAGPASPIGFDAAGRFTDTLPR